MQAVPSQRAVVVALAGNPNSGKTTLFNALTGLRYKVANYPGVTVERKEGSIALDQSGTVTIVDLPGLYSLESGSLDENIACQALLGKISGERKPDLIVSVVDATNLERNLYLTSQLIDLGVPIIVALTMSDISEKQGIDIKREILSRELDVPVVAVAASKNRGLAEIKSEIDKIIAQINLSTAKASKAAFKWRPQIKPESSAPETVEYHATRRYEWINKVVLQSCSTPASSQNSLTRRLDRVLLHRIWGNVIFIALMAFIFQAIFLWASIPMDFIDSLIARLGTFAKEALASGEVQSLIVDGVIPGVGSVLVFIPQIALLFFFIGLLEESGYLARAAFVVDNFMRRFGLQGRSFVPLLSSFACAIPGIMSTRTIPSIRDRMATIMIAPLMSCSARLPVYSVLIAACIPASTYLGIFSLQGLVLLSMYLLGILAALVVAHLLRLSVLKGQTASFVMEMPPFRKPSFTNILREVWDRVFLFIKSAGTIIMACSIVLWYLASHPGHEVRESYAASLGKFIEPAIKPLGFDWEIGVGIIASFAAREVFVSSLATVYNLESSDDASASLVSLLRDKHVQGTFSLASALSLMVFYVFACQCMSTLAVCRRETGSWGWTAFMFSYMTILAYGASFICYNATLWAVNRYG